jgi:hypothetical protein
MGTGSFPGVKWPGRGVDHPPSSSAEVKEKSIAIPLLPLWAFVACSRVTFTFTHFTLLYISLLGFYAAYNGNSIPTFRDNVSHL